MSSLAYFSGDGNFGMDMGNFVLLDVSRWTDDDWQEIEMASDWQRPALAVKISEKYA